MPANLEEGGVEIVIGGQWGDEGKGKLADCIAGDEGIETTLKPQGGHNAGHVTWVDGIEYKVHGFPTGIIRDDLKVVVGASVYTDPVGAMEELDYFESKGVQNLDPTRITVSYEARVVTPGHKWLDGNREDGRGGQGSTRKGIAYVASDKYRREDLDAYEAAEMSRKDLREYAEDDMVQAVASKGKTITQAERLAIEEWVNATERWQPFVGNGIDVVRGTLLDGKKVLAEGSQGMWLDIDHGPHKIGTSSHIELGGILNGGAIPIDEVTGIYMAVKAFKSRVGNGPFVTRFTDEDDAVYWSMKGKPGTAGYEAGSTTGRDRDLGYLDIPEIRESLSRLTLRGRDDRVQIALTKLDLLSDMGEVIKVATQHELDGIRQNNASKRADLLARSTPIYQELEGWNGIDISGCRTFNELPRAAQAFVSFLEEQLEVQVSLIGVGADRSQIIDRR